MVEVSTERSERLIGRPRDGTARRSGHVNPPFSKRFIDCAGVVDSAFADLTGAPNNIPDEFLVPLPQPTTWVRVW